MSTSSQQVSSIGRLRRRARALIRLHHAHDLAAADLLGPFHPDFTGLSPDEMFSKPLTLNEAQMVLILNRN